MTRPLSPSRFPPSEFPLDNIESSFPRIITEHMANLYHGKTVRPDRSACLFFVSNSLRETEMKPPSETKHLGSLNVFLHVVENWQNPRSHDRRFRTWLKHTYDTHLDDLEIWMTQAEKSELMDIPQWNRLVMQTVRACLDIVPRERLRIISSNPARFELDSLQPPHIASMTHPAYYDFSDESDDLYNLSDYTRNES